MVWTSLLAISLLLAPDWLLAKSADDYFHAGVQNYIFGEKDKAKKEIITGLQAFPDDPKLKGAWQLLQKKDEQQQQQQNQKQQQQQQQKKDQNNQQQQKSEQQKKDEQKAKQEQAKKDQEKKQQQAQAGQKDQKEQQAEQAAAELRMSPEEARQLLDQTKDDARVLVFSPTNKPANLERGKFKDW